MPLRAAGTVASLASAAMLGGTLPMGLLGLQLAPMNRLQVQLFNQTLSDWNFGGCYQPRGGNGDRPTPASPGACHVAGTCGNPRKSLAKPLAWPALPV